VERSLCVHPSIHKLCIVYNWVSHLCVRVQWVLEGVSRLGDGMGEGACATLPVCVCLNRI